jgi:hypothetical protein
VNLKRETMRTLPNRQLPEISHAAHHTVLTAGIDIKPPR